MHLEVMRQHETSRNFVRMLWGARTRALATRSFHWGPFAEVTWRFVPNFTARLAPQKMSVGQSEARMLWRWVSVIVYRFKKTGCLRFSSCIMRVALTSQESFPTVEREKRSIVLWETSCAFPPTSISRPYRGTPFSHYKGFLGVLPTQISLSEYVFSAMVPVNNIVVTIWCVEVTISRFPVVHTYNQMDHMFRPPWQHLEGSMSTILTTTSTPSSTSYIFNDGFDSSTTRIPSFRSTYSSTSNSSANATN
jgi:hypothetical protein